MEANDRVALERFTPNLLIAAAVVILAIAYTILHLSAADAHAGMHLSVARPPSISASSPDPIREITAWRLEYWSGHVEGVAHHSSEAGMLLQTIVFSTAALALLLLRSSDPTAQLCVLALALSGVAGGGPLLGGEAALPLGLAPAMTLFTWLAGPIAFPIIALAILYFPSESPLVKRHRALLAVPFVTAAPMIAMAAGTGMYVIGADSFRDAALWDATHAGVYFGSFAGALAVNIIAVGEGVYRYRYNHDANQRRRIRMAVVTGAPGVLAYALKEGVPIVAALVGAAPVAYPASVATVLQLLVLLPAFGLTYAVGVARVLGPRVVLRRSLQYALASRTLAVLPLLPGIPLGYALLHKNLQQLVMSRSVVYLLLFGATIAGLRYRGRARQMLDERFFREEYDARKILLSLASRVRFETDPADLASLVVRQIEQALHPERTMILAAGIVDGELTAVTATDGEIGSLPLASGLVAMLRWSDEPLEIYLDDPRSPARRLPPADVQWLERTRSALIVPVVGRDRALIGALVLGPKRSEEAYTAEDRELLGSIAVQVGLGLDVAKLRREMNTPATDSTVLVDAPAVLMQCARCGRVEDATVAKCPADNDTLTPGPVPRVIDGKYRIDQLLGRGGMGAVYRARDMRLDRPIAIKVVRPELLEDPEARRRFRREAQIVAKLQHPGIVAIHDFGTLPRGAAYLVMELVRGHDLRHELRREGHVDAARAIRILSTVCDAIQAAHAEGVLHRDLKPENILLPGGSIEAKVLDFGVAKLLGDKMEARDGDYTTLTLQGTVVGTPAYMAPEQLRAETPDARTDVFALGVIAYEMLSGELPFGRGSLADVVLAHARGPQRLSQVAPRVPAALDQAVMCAIQMNPDARPHSPEAFAAQLLMASGAAT